MEIIKNRSNKQLTTINGFEVQIGKDRKFDEDGNEMFYDEENYFIHGYIMDESKKGEYPDGVPSIWMKDGRQVGTTSGNVENPLNLVIPEGFSY